MRFLLGFIFGSYYAGDRVFRITFLLIILFVTFCLYEMSKPLSHNRPKPVSSAPREADKALERSHCAFQ
jgi:hypothetical protein